MARAKQRQDAVFTHLGLPHLCSEPATDAAQISAALASAAAELPEAAFQLPSTLLRSGSEPAAALQKTHDALQVYPHAPALLVAHAALLASSGSLATGATYAAAALAVYLKNSGVWSSKASSCIPAGPVAGVALEPSMLQRFQLLHHPAAAAQILMLCLAGLGHLGDAAAVVRHLDTIAGWALLGEQPSAHGVSSERGMPLPEWSHTAASALGALEAVQSAKERGNAHYSAGKFAEALEAYSAGIHESEGSLGFAPCTLHTNAAAAASAAGDSDTSAVLTHALAALALHGTSAKAWKFAYASLAAQSSPGAVAAAFAVAGVRQCLAPVDVTISSEVAALAGRLGADPVHHINSDEAWGEFIAKARADGVRRVVVDWFADWCGPCKAISPYVTSLAGAYHPSLLRFAKVNGDTVQDLVLQAGVSAFPTFHVYDPESGAKVDELRGASQPELQKLAYRAALGAAATKKTGPLASVEAKRSEAAAETVGVSAAVHDKLVAAAEAEGRAAPRTLSTALKAVRDARPSIGAAAAQ